jgi:hypothetical protein
MSNMTDETTTQASDQDEGAEEQKSEGEESTEEDQS